MRSSISWRAAVPAVVWVPSSSSQPRSTSESAEASQAASSQPRAVEHRPRHRAGGGHGDERLTAVEPRGHQGHHGPSPRCSRRTVAACHSARCGSSGQSSATFAAARGRPSMFSPSIAERAQRGGVGDAAGVDTRPSPSGPGPRILRRTLSTPTSRASRTRPGAARRRRVGDRPSHPVRLKLKKVASTTAGPPPPMGADRPAKSPSRSPSAPPSRTPRALLGEIGHGVQRLEELPHGAGGAGGVHRAMLPLPGEDIRATKHRRPMFDLRKAVAVVTGASSGSGVGSPGTWPTRARPSSASHAARTCSRAWTRS